MEVTGISAQVNALTAPSEDSMRKRRGARQWLAVKIVQLEGSMTRTAKKHARIVKQADSTTRLVKQPAKIAQWEGLMTKRGARQWLAANFVQLESQMQALEMQIVMLVLQAA